MSRIDKNRDIYEAWPVDTKQAVLEGKVDVGMTPDMVWIALGEPTDIVVRAGDKKTGEDEVWIYKKGGDIDDPSMMMPSPVMGPIGSGGGIVLAPGRGGVGVIPPAIGIGGVMGPGGGIGINGGMGGGMPMPVSRTPVQERDIIFKNGAVVQADPPLEKN
jgi:hypothetical protein